MSLPEEVETRDEVIAEVRRIKEELSARDDHDVRRIVERAMRDQEHSGHRLIRQPLTREK
jgi:hypothetical protein